MHYTLPINKEGKLFSLITKKKSLILVINYGTFEININFSLKHLNFVHELSLFIVSKVKVKT